uniref:hypothetical protein n=1 Tax=Cupriavidus taiwanensis TaxID=164546 RepID=UPI003F492B4C
MRDIRKVHEALLAQHFEDVDQLADKISDAAAKVERATATLTAMNGMPRPAISKPAPHRTTPHTRASWERRGMWAAAVIAGVIVSAGVGALVSRHQPVQTPEQAQATDIGRAIVRAWPRLDSATQTVIWNALDSQTQEALAYSVRRR